MDEAKIYVWTDEHGVMRVGKTRVTLDGVIAGFREGLSPECIRSDYPALSLEEVYGAITYILANPQDVEAYVKRQEEAWERARAENEKNISPVVARLRALKAAQAEHK